MNLLRTIPETLSQDKRVGTPDDVRLALTVAVDMLSKYKPGNEFVALYSVVVDEINDQTRAILLRAFEASGGIPDEDLRLAVKKWEAESDASSSD